MIQPFPRHASFPVGAIALCAILGWAIPWVPAAFAQAPAAGTTCCKCRPANATSDTCVTTETSRFPDPSNCQGITTISPSLAGWTCDTPPLTTACQRITAGGVCPAEPVSAFAAGSASEPVGSRSSGGATQNAPGILPSLNVQIPGLTFLPQDADTKNSSLLAQYIAASYSYLITIAATVATIMFIWGAFLYLVGTALPSIKRGEEIMKDAVVGLLLVLSAHLILRTVNPATLNLSALYIQGVNPVDLGNYGYFVPQTTGSLPTNVSSEVPTMSKQEIAQGIMEGARLAGADPCAMLAICDHETGLRPLWNGVLSGTPKERAIAFGPCQVVASQMHANNGLVPRIRAAFPDFPLVEKSQMQSGGKLVVGDWLLRNPKGSGYVAALIFQTNVKAFNNNEIAGVAGYAAGALSLKNWQRANSCTPPSGMQIEAGGASAQAACVPRSVGIANAGEGKGCPEDGWVCGNVKAEKTAEFVGHCSNGKKCYAMVTDAFANYVIRAYPRMVSTYRCQ